MPRAVLVSPVGAIKPKLPTLTGLALKGVNVSEELETPLKEKQAAKYIGVNHTTIRLWRYEGKGPSFFKAGDKLIRYRKSDLDRWIAERLTEPSAIQSAK